MIEQALCHNPETRQAWANARQQASQLGVAQSAYLPSLNFSMPISRSKNTAGGGISNGVPVQGGGDFCLAIGHGGVLRERRGGAQRRAENGG